MKFVCSFAFTPVDHLIPAARAVEKAGFDSISVSDHVVHPETIKTPYPYTEDGGLRWEPFTPWPDVWTSIAAMAAVTEHVRFHTAVYVLPMRNPFVVAKAVGTVAALSNDRVSLGIGTGWFRDEFELLEQPFERRGKRTDEMVEVLRKLWSGGMVEHHGEFYDFDRLEMTPVPREPIPILVGGLSERAFRRAAVVGDGWISDLHTTDEIREVISKIRAYRKDSPRAGEPLTFMVSCLDAFDRDGYQRLEDLGVTHVQTKPWMLYGGEESDLQAKFDSLEKFADENIR